MNRIPSFLIEDKFSVVTSCESATWGGAAIKYRFTGKEKDSCGLYYYGARYYDPELGRFISPDIVLDGLNRYTYCGNNPIKYNDPTGLFSIQGEDAGNGYGYPSTGTGNSTESSNGYSTSIVDGRIVVHYHDDANNLECWYWEDQYSSGNSEIDSYVSSLRNVINDIISECRSEIEAERELIEKDKELLQLQDASFPLPDWLNSAWRDFQSLVGELNKATRGTKINNRIIDWFVKDAKGNIMKAIEAKYVQYIKNTPQLQNFVKNFSSKFELWITSYTKSIDVKLLNSIKEANGKVIMFIEGVPRALNIDGLMKAGGRIDSAPVIVIPDFMFLIPGPGQDKYSGA